MDRYHSPGGTGTGLPLNDKNLKRLAERTDGCPVCGEDNVMYASPSGFWVLFEDALKRSRQEFDKGMDEGLKKGATCEVCHEAGVALGEARAASQILQAYNDGLKVGRAQGQTKLEAYQASIKATPNIGDVYLERTGSGDVAVRGLSDTDFVGYAGLLGLLRVSTLKGYRDAAEKARAPGPVVQVDGPDTRTNQLLNELYHDRARLEKVIKSVLTISQGFVEGLATDLANGDISKKLYETYSELFGAHEQAVADHGGVA